MIPSFRKPADSRGAGQVMLPEPDPLAGPASGTGLGFRPQLDGLRAFAVLTVLVGHFWTDYGRGDLGVRLFFILSGFLITGILLGQRDAGTPLGRRLRVFFARRVLRIWPIYYGVLAAAWLVDLGGIRPSMPWHLAQLSNVYFLVRGSFEPWVAAHLWTLSMEEQFYLVWPWAALLLTRSRLRGLLATVIIAAAALRLLGVVLDEATGGMIITVTTAFDGLAIGAALGAAPLWGLSLERMRGILGRAAVASIAGLVIAALLPVANLYVSVEHTLFGIIFAWLVVGATLGFGGVAGAVLEHRMTVHLGRISYGIYLYHLFVAGVIVAAAERFGVSLAIPKPVFFLLMSGATLVVAELSWHVVEQPINGLKRHFPYERPLSARG